MSEDSIDKAVAATKEAVKVSVAAEEHPSLRIFLESHPPSKSLAVAETWHPIHRHGVTRYQIGMPEISLYCENDKCNGSRIFRCDDGLSLKDDWDWYFRTFICSNCGTEWKSFALAFKVDPKKPGVVTAYKYGELPVFGPRVPEKLKKLVGSDRDLFFSGLRCEAQGLGIAAFSYYRRVVEDRKNKLLDQLIKVTKTVDPSNQIIQEFEAAKEETQFTKAIDSIKGSFPQSLLIEGQNPLKLLYNALSQGIHDPPTRSVLRSHKESALFCLS